MQAETFGNTDTDANVSPPDRVMTSRSLRLKLLTLPWQVPATGGVYMQPPVYAQYTEITSSTGAEDTCVHGDRFWLKTLLKNQNVAVLM